MGCQRGTWGGGGGGVNLVGALISPAAVLPPGGEERRGGTQLRFTAYHHHWRSGPTEVAEESLPVPLDNLAAHSQLSTALNVRTGGFACPTSPRAALWPLTLLRSGTVLTATFRHDLRNNSTHCFHLPRKMYLQNHSDLQNGTDTCSLNRIIYLYSHTPL